MKEEMGKVESWKRLKQEQFGQDKGVSANHFKPEVTLLLRKQAREGYARTIFHQRQSHGHISISKIMSVQKIKAKKKKRKEKKERNRTESNEGSTANQTQGREEMYKTWVYGSWD